MHDTSGTTAACGVGPGRSVGSRVDLQGHVRGDGDIPVAPVSVEAGGHADGFNGGGAVVGARGPPFNVEAGE
ncbi:hypothetical protein UN64_19505 [Fictibacillus arsenicus]|uniref:Uncharacterized protein n=1 Tax=Fictibacillus arsenicus TaxID=255247 RepID=A0A1V3FZH0_9BACL|nr:hypothetical protein UN64_19505 [Fictibacillus arsenicus]